jgi:3-oxoadipyl-CoA thiolase
MSDLIPAFVLDYVRTPIGKWGGALAGIRPDDLAAHVISRVFDPYPEFQPRAVDDVMLGCSNQSGEDARNVARMALLLAGLPTRVPGETVNRLCASGMAAVVNAARAVRCGDANLIVAGGVESMSRAPFVISKSGRPYGRDVAMEDTTIGWRFINPTLHERVGSDSMGMTAEHVAEEFAISRKDQDAFALRSQLKASAARERGRLAREITPVEIPRRKGGSVRVEHDEFIRPDSTAEALAALRPVFASGGSVTAGNASGINDGACAVLVGSEAGAARIGGTPKARIVSSAVVGVKPRTMGMGPVPATRVALERAGLSLNDIDVIELNEAFAAQALACIRELGLADDDARVNPNGGAIALGHPLGMTGARLIATACEQLQTAGVRRALATLCVGVGQGMAVILEKV